MLFVKKALVVGLGDLVSRQLAQWHSVPHVVYHGCCFNEKSQVGFASKLRPSDSSCAPCVAAATCSDRNIRLLAVFAQLFTAGRAQLLMKRNDQRISHCPGSTRHAACRTVAS